MYGKTSKSTHYLPRKGSYSTVPQRNGRVDVLPPDAKLHLYDVQAQITDGEVRISQLTQQIEAARADLHRLNGLDRFRANHTRASDYRPMTEVSETRSKIDSLEASLRATKKHVGDLRSLFGGAQKLSREQAFMRVAEIELPPDVYRKLLAHADAISATRKR